MQDDPDESVVDEGIGRIGRLGGDGADDTKDGLSSAARARVGAAFARGAEHGLLDLGTTELDAPLSPPLAFLREIGRAFATRLRAAPDLEERGERGEVDCPPDECARLAGAVPPMPGAEYVDSDWIVARWAEIGNAFAEEIPFRASGSAPCGSHTATSNEDRVGCFEPVRPL